jgi:hypothetical protein
MTPIQKQIVALYEFTGDSPYLSEGWATRDYKRTFEQAMALCKPEIETSMGVNMWWSVFAPTVISMSRTSLVTERTDARKSLVLEGKLAEALLADLTELATVKMAAKIREEQELALKAAAVNRVAQMLQAAAVPAGVPA